MTGPIDTGVFVTYNPFPLVLLKLSDGTEAIHISPNAHEIVSAVFGRWKAKAWDKELGRRLKEVGMLLSDCIDLTRC